MTTDTDYRLAHSTEMPQPGDIVAERYAIESVLGEGGFAAVFRAQDQRVGQAVAVKVLDPLMSRRPQFAARFDREIRTVSSLRHPNTITVMDRGTTKAGCLYVVMELLSGSPLDDVVRKQGPMDPERAGHIIAQVLRSLNEAHLKGVIHRDIKPANIFLVDLPGERDFVKVLDFGIAKTIDESDSQALTQTGEVMCSPHYVSPERVRDLKSFPASDLYSVGILMIELLEGKPPYEGDSTFAIAVQHANMEVPVPMADSTRNSMLGPVISRAVQKSVANRYQSADEMLTDLLQALRGQLATGRGMASVGSDSSGTKAFGADDATRSMSPSGPTRVQRVPSPRNNAILAFGVVGIIVLAAAVLLYNVVASDPYNMQPAVPIPTPTVGPAVAPGEAPAPLPAEASAAVVEVVPTVPPTEASTAEASGLAQGEGSVVAQPLVEPPPVEQPVVEPTPVARPARPNTVRNTEPAVEPPSVPTPPAPTPEPTPEPTPTPEPAPEPTPTERPRGSRFGQDLRPR